MTVANKEYKDRLFHFIFGDETHKDWALSLYNAVNRTHYTDTEKLTFNTIREVMYLGMHNDVSFLIDTVDLYSEMNLYEQQSSFCPNIPLRKLQYAGDLYEKYLLENKLNKYGRKLVPLPVPKLVTFYIGIEEHTDEQILRLSDSFPEGVESDIEVRVRMININQGHNREILKTCRPLYEYSWLIREIRRFLKETADLSQAVDIAIESMPADYVLKDFLTVNRMEVKTMLLTEYNESETNEMFKEEGRTEGAIEMLVSLVKDGIISIKDAAARVGLSEASFKKEMAGK